MSETLMLVVGIVLLVLAVLWIILPLILLDRLNKIIALLTSIDSAETIAQHERLRDRVAG